MLHTTTVESSIKFKIYFFKKSKSLQPVPRLTDDHQMRNKKFLNKILLYITYTIPRGQQQKSSIKTNTRRK